MAVVMRPRDIPINGSFICTEELQIIMLAVLAVSIEDTCAFTGFSKWEVNKLRAHACAVLGANNAQVMAYVAQDFEFTRSGLYKGKPVFTPKQQQKLLAIAPHIRFAPPAAV